MGDNQVVEKKLVTSHIFKDNIERVWDIMTDLSLSDVALQDLRGPVEMITGDKTNQISSSFKYLDKNKNNNFYLIFKCVFVEISTLTKRIEWTISIDLLNISYTYIFTFHKITLEKKTLLIWEIIWKNDGYPLMNQEMFEAYKIDLMKKKEKLLKKSIIRLNQIESIVINSDYEKIWNMITDWKEFKKVSTLVANEVNYFGDPLEIDTKFQIKFYTFKMECWLRVMKVEKEEGDYVLECYLGTPKCPPQDIKFKLIKLADKQTYLSLEHTFKKPIQYEKLEKMGQDKQKILTNLKIYLEKEE